MAKLIITFRDEKYELGCFNYNQIDDSFIELLEENKSNPEIQKRRFVGGLGRDVISFPEISHLITNIQKIYSNLYLIDFFVLETSRGLSLKYLLKATHVLLGERVQIEKIILPVLINEDKKLLSINIAAYEWNNTTGL